ncbi:MAG: NADH-quinone oxidoreductase subunit NuoE [Gammaproteobacteria bacterium]|nr:NADH-quinone oxidoreductase subunit NuoE [Gammaproteobacteria bacterium]
MPEKSKQPSLFSASVKAEIDKWIKRYPADQKRSAVIPALHVVQRSNGGWLTTESMDAVADYLEMPRIAVYEVGTFYSMFVHEPTGRHKINVCTNVSCMLCGSDEIVSHLQKRLGIKLGETTPDNKFTLREVECLAACGGAPMMQVNRDYHEDLTPEKIDEILDGFE